jgi:hypothetical protein
MSKCGCIKGDFDFLFYPHSCDKLIFEDLSTWVEDERPESYFLSITLPDQDVPTALEVRAVGSNLITSDKFGDKPNCFLDGIYELSVDNCGTIYTKKKAITCQLDCKLSKLISEASTDRDFSRAEKLRFYIDAIHRNVELGKSQAATDFFNLASRELECINCVCQS